MISVLLGLGAALAWGIHDLLVRIISRNLSIPVALFTVLSIGTLACLPMAILFNEGLAITPFATVQSILAGICYVIGCLGLYHAFAEGPVKLVAPIIGAYPVLSVTGAALTGTTITLGNWVAVFAIIAGVALVAILSDPGDIPQKRLRAMIYAAASGIGFAATFALSQAAAGGGGGWSVLLLARLVAMGLVFALVLSHRPSFRPALHQAGVLSAMGVLDAMALGLVTLAGIFPNPEFAATTTSIFGVVTILLSRVFLKETVTAPQWAGIALVFLGVAMLGMH